MSTFYNRGYAIIKNNHNDQLAKELAESWIYKHLKLYSLPKPFHLQAVYKIAYLSLPSPSPTQAV